MDFKSLKKSSGGFSLDRLAQELEKINAPLEKAGDDRFWYPAVDASGNGSAIIRFLPAPAVDGEDALPWVRIFHHGFQGPTGKWYIENSLTTLGLKDPVSDYNSKLWNSSSDDNGPERKQVRKQKRKLNYISNIYVISDPKNPENEGKVFLFRYGKKIFDKITLLMNPEFEDDQPVNPFDFWEGANFKMRIRNVDGYRNYDQSNFESPKPLFDDDKRLEEIWKSEYSLNDHVSPDVFKSYDDLDRRLREVLDEEVAEPMERNIPFESPAPASRKPEVRKATPAANVDDEDDDLAAFKSLIDD